MSQIPNKNERAVIVLATITLVIALGTGAVAAYAWVVTH